MIKKLLGWGYDRVAKGSPARAGVTPAWSPPKEAVDPWRSLNIVGEGFRNPDGRSRQDEIAKIRPGEPILLKREPQNPHDGNAVRVCRSNGVAIGYIGRDHSRWIGGKIDAGYTVEARVERVVGGTPSKPSLGVLLAVRITA